MKKFVLLILLCLIVFSSIAQKSGKRDTLVNKDGISIKSQLIPLGLITTGAIIASTHTREYLQDQWGNTTCTKLDDYIQYIPDLTVFAAHFAGFKHKNTLLNTAKFMAISQLTTAIIVQSCKRIFDVPRPYGGRYTFPSGHTSQAFVGATAQYHEFKDYSPWFAYCGYAFAAAVGAMRVTNNRHWVPDVLCGAGIGMLVTNIVYYYEPFKEWDPFKKKKYAFVPGLGFQGSTAVASLSFTF